MPQTSGDRLQSLAPAALAALARVRVVLVRTSDPGNIGAAARAMLTMGLTRLVLVAPQRFPDPKASARAAGAAALLEQAQVVATLDQALLGCERVYGCSGKHWRLPLAVLTPAEAAPLLLHQAMVGDVALVFGTERTGLELVELDRCAAQVLIPANPAYPSLNLAQAVQVLAYALRHEALANGAQPPARVLAAHETLEAFYAHLESVLTELEFLDPQNPRHMMRRLRRLYGRAELDDSEVHILRGVLSSLAKRGRALESRLARPAADCSER